MKRNGIPLIFTLALIFFALVSCEKNNEVDLYGIETCDTIAPTWENSIASLFITKCVYCHNADLHYKNVRHDNYKEELKVISDGGDRLRAVINHEPVFTRMPYERAKLSDCNIQMIETWLDNGAPEK